VIADWEATGVFFADTLQVRHPDLFALVQSTLGSHGVEVRVLHHVRDIWARDFCPIQVRPGQLVQFRYEPDYLAEHAELRTDRAVARQFAEVGEIQHSDINLDGGNVVASRSKAIITDKVYRENSDWNRAELREKLRKILQVEQLVVIPKEPYDPIGHTDAMVRFIDENTVWLNDYSKVAPTFGDRLAETLHRHGLKITLAPYFLERQSTNGIPSAVGCFTNFLRTEKVVLVPAYGRKQDRIARERLHALIPDVPIVSVDCTNLARQGGVLNCVCASYRSFPKGA
jgi:agmatine deiminase